MSLGAMITLELPAMLIAGHVMHFPKGVRNKQQNMIYHDQDRREGPEGNRPGARRQRVYNYLGNAR
jgi:hypothetical protein